MRVGGSVGGGFAPLAVQERAKVAGARAIGRAWQSGSEAHRSGKCRTCADGCGVDLSRRCRRLRRGRGDRLPLRGAERCAAVDCAEGINTSAKGGIVVEY